MIVTFSDHLRSLMDSRKLKAADLARATGITHVAIGNYLNGRVPKWDQAQKLAEFFGLHPDYLLNPERYSKGITKAAELASMTPGGEDAQTKAFNDLTLAATRQLKSRQEGFDAAMQLNESETVYGINWRERAEKAEAQLAVLKALLSETAQKIILPE